MKKLEYTNLEMNVIEIDQIDVIRTSITNEDDGGVSLPSIPIPRPGRS